MGTVPLLPRLEKLMQQHLSLSSQLLTLHVGSRHYTIFHQRESKTENPSAIFPSIPFSMSGWFIFALVGSRHYRVYSCQREFEEGNPNVIFHSSLSISGWFIPVLQLLTLHVGSSTTVYFTKENRREKPKCHLPFFPRFSERLVYLCSCG